MGVQGADLSLRKRVRAEVERHQVTSRSGSKSALVYVVDADSAVRDGLESLLRLLELEVESYSTAEELLARNTFDSHACVVAEVQLPGMSGLELHDELKARGTNLPVILLASRGDVPTAVRALRGGAVDFIEKPFVDRVLAARIEEVLGLSCSDHRQQAASRVTGNRNL